MLPPPFLGRCPIEAKCSQRRQVYVHLPSQQCHGLEESRSSWEVGLLPQLLDVWQISLKPFQAVKVGITLAVCNLLPAFLLDVFHIQPQAFLICSLTLL